MAYAQFWLCQDPSKDGRSYEGEYINDQKDGEAHRLIPQPPCIFIPMEAEFSCRSKFFGLGLFRLRSA